MRNKFILALLFLFISFQTFAAKISGVVIDADSTPVIGAVVAIKELGKGTQTDENGAFEFTGVESGTYELVFSMVAYKKMLQTVTVFNNKDIVVNVSLKSEANKLSDVVVRTNKVTNTENAVMMEIRKANVTVSGISAAQIGKTTDRNAADVVKRIPGVSITEDRFIVVRGLPERYNTVWLNDGSAPSSEVDKKSFSFDIVPSGLIDRVMVYKTPSPELPGDFAGGMVKIYTTSIPDKNQITVSVEGSHRQRSTGSDFTYAPVSSTDWLGYDDGSRGLPGFAGHRVSRNDSNNSQVTKAWGNDWILKQKKQGPDGRFNLSASGIWKLGKVRIGNTFGASYSNVSTNYEGTQHSWDSTDMTYSGVDNQSVNNINVGLMNNLGFAFGNSKIEFRNLYNQLGKSYVFVRSTVRDTAIESQVDEMSYALGYESRAIYTSQLSGVHKTKNDKTKYNWTLGYTDVFKNIPNLKRIKYSRPYPTGVEDTTTYVYMAGTNANSTPDAINGGGRYFAELYEHTYSFNHHFNQKFNVMGYEFEANVGNFIEYKNRNFWQRNLGHSIQTGPFANALKSLPINEIFADSNLGYKDRFRLGEGTDSSDKYKVENTLIASFISVKLPIGKFTVLGGVRYEYNDLFLRGFVNLDSVGPKVNTKFWLPSVNVSYDINDKSLVRVAYGKTLNRPEFREFSPLFFYDFETRTNMYGAMFPTKFADTLDVAQVQNFDLRWEWYPSSGEMVHAGVFYKLFKSPIQTVMEYDDPERRAITYMNAKEAYSRGIEIDIRKDFRFLDNIFNTKFFRNASIVGNAAFIQSELTNDTSVKSNQLANLPLQGQSPYMFNIGLFYQGNTGFQSSLLYNVCGPRLFLLGTQDTPPIGELPFDMLDFKFSKTFYKHYTLNFSVQNILDSKVRRVQDVDQNGEFEKKDYEVLSYKPGRYVSVGVKVRF
jgi:Outer membrane receptor proteins, mostly Fe transport